MSTCRAYTNFDGHAEDATGQTEPAWYLETSVYGKIYIDFKRNDYVEYQPTHLFPMVSLAFSGCGKPGWVVEKGEADLGTNTHQRVLRLLAMSPTNEDAKVTSSDVYRDYTNNLTLVYQVDIDVSLPLSSASV